MQAREATRYLDVSETKFRRIGLRSKHPGGNRLWDIRDLDDYADRLEHDGKHSCGTKTNEATSVPFGITPSQAAA